MLIILDIVDNNKRDNKIESLESLKCDKDNKVINNRERFIRLYTIR